MHDLLEDPSARCDGMYGRRVAASNTILESARDVSGQTRLGREEAWCTCLLSPRRSCCRFTSFLRTKCVTPVHPTSKNACKKGGWKTFTSPKFKNQGQCVSYVASHGRKQHHK